MAAASASTATKKSCARPGFPPSRSRPRCASLRGCMPAPRPWTAKPTASQSRQRLSLFPYLAVQGIYLGLRGIMASESALAAGLSELMVLRLLREQEMYGYEIVQAIAARTRQALTPGEGVIYPLLHALEKDGLLKSRRKTVGGRSRIYYSLYAR